MSINPKIFNKSYYYNICFGSEEFKKSEGLLIHPRVKKVIDQLYLNKKMDVLEIGCGRGDVGLYLAKKVRSFVGIDYSPEAIKIAREIRNKYQLSIQKKTKFFVMKANKLKFKSKSFDIILLIDTLDHLNNKEQEETFQEIIRVITDDGELFIRTCSNRILLSSTYKNYIYPLNRFLTWLDKKIKNANYDPLPKDPRTKEQKQQHINEPDYFKLKKLFRKYFLNNQIKSETGFLKEGMGIRTILYNFVVTLQPFSEHYPLNILFASSFICKLTSPIR